MSILLVRVGGEGFEQLCLEGPGEAEDLWSASVTEGEISEQLEALGVQVLPADHTQVVDGEEVNVHPLVLTGRAQRILAATYFLDADQEYPLSQVLH